MQEPTYDLIYYSLHKGNRTIITPPNRWDRLRSACTVSSSPVAGVWFARYLSSMPTPLQWAVTLAVLRILRARTNDFDVIELGYANVLDILDTFIDHVADRNMYKNPFNNQLPAVDVLSLVNSQLNLHPIFPYDYKPRYMIMRGRELSTMTGLTVQQFDTAVFDEVKRILSIDGVMFNEFETSFEI